MSLSSTSILFFVSKPCVIYLSSLLGLYLPQEEECFLEVFPQGVSNSQLRHRWTDVLDPTVLRGSFDKFEFETLFDTQKRLKKPNAFAFIGDLLGRTADNCKRLWKCYHKKLWKRLTEATGRSISSDVDLIGENGMYEREEAEVDGENSEEEGN